MAGQKKNGKNSTSTSILLTDCISGPAPEKKALGSGLSNLNRKLHCYHYGRDNHKLSKCCYLSESKCADCRQFYDGEKCWEPPSGGSKHPWKGKDSNTSTNKKRKESHNVDDSAQTAQSNVAIPVTGSLVSFTANEEADASDDKEFDCHVNKYVGLSKYTDRIYDWLADSGLTIHIINRHDAFDTYDPISKTKVTDVGEIEAFVVGTGTIYLHSKCDGVTCA